MKQRSQRQRDRAAGLPAGRLTIARWALRWESLWPALWPAVLALGAFLVAALSDLLPVLPGWLHAALLAGFAAALAFGAWKAHADYRAPDALAARRRLEQDSGLAHRPLTAVSDTLTGGRTAPETAALWRAHQESARHQLKHLRLRLPRAGLAARDPVALRALVVLLLVITGIGAGGQAPQRVLRALQPDLSGLGGGAPARLDVWITPPAYTGMAPAFLGAEGPKVEALSVPSGSLVMAQVNGGRGVPSLFVGSAESPFLEIDPGTFRIESKLEEGDSLAVKQSGRELGRWPLQVLADLAPVVSFSRPPTETHQSVLRLDYGARDDYGIAGVKAVIRRLDGASGPAGMEKIELALPPPHPSPKHGGAASFHDLTSHPWAGIPVEIVLEARDSPGQIGRGEVLAIIMPERDFRHPVALAVIEQRRHLTLLPNDRLAVMRALNRIAGNPAAYDDDVVVALALHIAGRRLVNDPRPETVADVQSLLWDTALRIEEGELAILAQRLRDAQQALQNALNGDAGDEEIDRLMDQLQQLMNQYLEALLQEAERNAAEAREQGLTPNEVMPVERQDLQRMLDRARELAEVGAREAARDLLARLQELLENLRAALEDGGGDQASQQAMQMMRDLDSLTERQQQLLERSFRQSQQMPPEGGFDTQSDATQQEMLRRELGDIMRRFGEITGDIPAPLGRGERAMRDAVGALEEGEPAAAVDPQSRALNELRQGAQAMLEKLLQQMGENGQDGAGIDRYGRLDDPLGRDERGMGLMDTGDVRIPEEADVQRARQILDELRRRMGEPDRPRSERDYIERLLPRF